MEAESEGVYLFAMIIWVAINFCEFNSTMLSRTAVGARVCIFLLDVMLKLFDAEESTQGAQAFDVG